MGTTRYANAAGSNTAPYDTVAKGATDPQTIIDLAVAGDTNYYYGTFTLSAILDFDTNAGSLANGFVKHIGCNAAGVNDGTLAIFNGNSAVANVIKSILNMHFHWLENIEIKNATSYGINISAAATGWFLRNCLIHNNGNTGIYNGAGTANNWQFVKCRIYSNSGWGIYGISNGPLYLGCSVYLNTSGGIYGWTYSAPLVINSLIYSNSVYGLYGSNVYFMVINSIINNNVIGIYNYGASGYNPILIGNKFSNNATCAIKIDIAGKVVYSNFNKFDGNGANVITAGSVILDQESDLTDAIDDYVNKAIYNFTLNTPIAPRIKSLIIDSLNTAYMVPGVGYSPDFPGVANVRPTDTVDGVTGTHAILATDADYVALEATRNSDPGVANVSDGVTYKITGTDLEGTLVALDPPAAITITSADGLSSTSIRVNIAWAANAARIHIERSTSPTGSFTEITGSPLTSGNYLDDTTSGTKYYRARGWNNGGYGSYGAVVEGVCRASNSIEQLLWSTFKTKMQADSYLTSYISKWKFNREANILSESNFPVLKAWIADTSEDWKGIPKNKIVRCRVVIHTLVKSVTDLETEKLKADEYIKNAIEADMTFAGGVTMNIVGDTIFRNLDDSMAEIFIECEILSTRFTAGQR